MVVLDSDHDPKLVDLIGIEVPVWSWIDVLGAGAGMSREFLLPIDHEVARLEKHGHLSRAPSLADRTEGAPTAELYQANRQEGNKKGPSGDVVRSRILLRHRAKTHDPLYYRPYF
jgi:hypothetical protein